MTPNTETELAGAVKAAAAKGQRLRIRGGGTRSRLGRPVEADETLSTTGLTGISLYEPGALTIVAAAGTPVAEIKAVLNAEGQRLPFEPMDHSGLLGSEGEPTIGSVVACNISGPRRIQAGACRDSLIGVRFVDGQGTVIKNGGRVMKNVTGYDLVKLMAGSYGTLGVLTEVAFKVLPKPEARAVVLIGGLDDRAAAKAMSAALGSPYDVTGAAHLPVGVDGDPVTMIRVEGFEASVAYRADKLRDLLSSHGDIAIENDPEKTEAGWAYVRDVAPFHDREGDVWRVSVKPSDGPDLIEAMRNAGQSVNVLYDWGGGLIWVLATEGTDIRPHCPAGHATLIRASDETKTRLPVFQPQADVLERVSRDLREKFDPKNILNPGLMG
jgi:glycolate oxidase FAD binding subunit